MEGVVDRIIGWPGRARSSTQLLVLSLFLIEIVAALARPAGLAPRVVAATCGLLLIVAVAALLRRLRFDAGTILVVLGGVWLYLGYLGYTAYTERNYDAGAQLEYIEFIVKNHRLPKADGCFVCHHPPLYYVLGAFAYAIFQRVRLIPPADGLQLYSLVLCIGFIVFGALLSRELAKDRREVQLATALVVFWPYGVHNSVRVHNDSLVSTLLVASLWLTVRFARRDRPRDLYLAGFVGALAILTKTSAIVIVVVLALLLAHRLFRAPDKLRTLGRGLLVGGMLAAALFLNAVRKDAPLEREPAPRGALCEKLLGSACHIGEHQFVGNKAKNYLWFDLKSFVEEPYFIAERDVAGRQYFWNDLLKSSLFGTHNTVPDRETSYELNKYMAMGMNWLLLGMTGYLGAGLVAMRKEERRRFALIGLFVVLSIVFLAGFKILVPAPHHNDFRHVFPVVVPMAIVYAASVARFRRSSALLSGLGLALAGAFVALSIAYFVPKYDWAMRVTARTIPHDLAEFSAIVPEGTPWDKDTNLFIDGNHTIELRSKTPLTVRQLDLSVDNNDTYEITIVGATETRVLSVGPRPMKGLARYFVPVNPPVEGVSVLRLRPTGGDRAYSMGHFVVR